MENKVQTENNTRLDPAAQEDPRSRIAREELDKKALWLPPQNGLPRTYASSFDLGDGISASSVLTDKSRAKDYDKLLEIIPISTGQAYVRFAENATAQNQVWGDTYTHLNPKVVNSLNKYDHNVHTHISTLQAGRLVLEGEKWRLVEKMDVRFDALTPEQVQAQTATLAQPPLTATEPVLKNESPPPVGQSLPKLDVLSPAPTLVAADLKPEPVGTVPNLPALEPKPEQTPEAEIPVTLRLTALTEQQAQHELIKERFYEALIPQEYQELRSFLRNDGFLSNEEINAALRDGRLEREELAQKLSDKKIPGEDTGLREKMTDYLWELHQIVQDLPLDSVRAGQLYKVERVDTLPNHEGGAEAGRNGDAKKDTGLDIIRGGMLANFLHNYKKQYNAAQNPDLKIDNGNTKKNRYQWQDVEQPLAKMGLTRAVLEQSGNLDRLLRGEKTGLIDFKSEINGQSTPLRGKIYLVKVGSEVMPYFQTQKQTLLVPEKYMGYQFSPEDREQLTKRGELGKLVDLEDKVTKNTFKGYIGVDKETNSLSVWRAERVHIPMQIKGADVSADQQETLRQGGSIRLSGMTGENGQKFDADVQVSAGKRSLGFSPPSEAISLAIDAKTGKDLQRSPDKLQGTAVGGSTAQGKQNEVARETGKKPEGTQLEQGATPAKKTAPARKKDAGQGQSL